MDHQQEPLRNEENENGYIQTSSQAYVSRQANLYGPKNVVLLGKTVIQPGCIIRGDFESMITVGRYCHFENGTILRPSYTLLPPTKTSKDKTSISALSSSQQIDDWSVQYLPMFIGSHTRIGSNCVIEAASIGSNVRIGKDCVISPRAIVKDVCIVEDDTVIPPDMVVPPFSRVRGKPGRIVEHSLPESAAIELEKVAVTSFRQFVRDLESESNVS
mmetsp:Transcript_13399/g.19166  ORF Transcript_13399/g.19166 Transcript_13399/m.19166 type:complete len:216 (+) Transcript_13399:44-691(+)